MGWTEQEKRKYIARDYPPLRRMYFELGLSYEEPEKRAAFLFKIIDPRLTLCETITKLSEDYGRHTALNLLEDIVIEFHERKISKLGESIDLRSLN